MLPALFNIPNIEDMRSVNEWSFAHADHHLQIINALLAQDSVVAPVYILDPIPFFDMGAWLYQHQTMHNNNNLVLNTNTGNDLTQLDVSKPEEVASWVWLNASEHRLWANALGVG